MEGLTRFSKKQVTVSSNAETAKSCMSSPHGQTGERSFAWKIQCEVADTFFARMKGLLGRKNLTEGTGLILFPCNSVHMWGMGFTIDALFLSQFSQRSTDRFKNGSHWRVEKIVSDWKPWSILPQSCSKAQSVLECPGGTIQKHSIQVGDILCIE